jgi:hypothetical protein
MMVACEGPSPKTVWVPLFQRSQALQLLAADCNMGSVGFGGTGAVEFFFVESFAIEIFLSVEGRDERKLAAGFRGLPGDFIDVS